VVSWTDDVDEILASDLAVGFAYLMTAKGVVISPMAPLGLRDRQAGTVTVTTSQAMWKRLDRLRHNSGVAIAYHTREHGLTDRSGFVLVQGRASFQTTAIQAGDSGVMLSVPAGSVPDGGRRAGLTSHQFQPRMIGQEQRVHTGWLESDGSDRVENAPHTNAGYRLPRSKLGFILARGSIAFRMKKARAAGVAPQHVS
jgi:hypothetical protein